MKKLILATFISILSSATQASASEFFTPNVPALEKTLSGTVSAKYESDFVSYKSKKAIVNFSNRTSFYKVGEKTIFKSVNQNNELFLYDLTPKSGSKDFVQFIQGNQTIETLAVSFPQNVPLFLSSSLGRNLEATTSTAATINFQPIKGVLFAVGTEEQKLGLSSGSLATSINLKGEITAAISLNKELSIGATTKNNSIVGQWRFGNMTVDLRYSIVNQGLSAGINQTL